LHKAALLCKGFERPIGSIAAAISFQGNIVSNASNIRDNLVLQLMASARRYHKDVCQDIHVAQDVHMI